ncbi:MAG: GNAT family N-acetyltransferase [Bacteroidota bacterium]
MKISTKHPDFFIHEATIDDCTLLLTFIKELAEYEKLPHEVVADEETLAKSLFGEKQYAKAIIGEYKGEPVGFALYFHNFSTFVGRPGLYLEDLYIRPAMRGKGFGKILLSYLAKVAKELNCGRMEWWVLDWNKSAIDFYKSIGAKPMDEWTVYRVIGEALDKLAEQY